MIKNVANWILELLRGLFKASSSPLIPEVIVIEPEIVEPKELPKMKVAIVIGHAHGSKGACSPFGLPCEWDFNKAIAEGVADKNKDVTLFFHDSYDRGYKTMVQKTSNEINKGNFDLVLELHYNAASELANGCEALYYFANKKAQELSETFCYLVNKELGIKSRGSKALLTKNDRGYWAVFLPNPLTLILEPFFGTNKSDIEKIKGNEDKYIAVILTLIEHYKI